MSLANPANTTISSIIDQALKDHAEGRQQQAMTGFQTVLQHDSGNVVALYMLGAMHSEREQYQGKRVNRSN